MHLHDTYWFLYTHSYDIKTFLSSLQPWGSVNTLWILFSAQNVERSSEFCHLPDRSPSSSCHCPMKSQVKTEWWHNFSPTRILWASASLDFTKTPTRDSVAYYRHTLSPRSTHSLETQKWALPHIWETGVTGFYSSFSSPWETLTQLQGPIVCIDWRSFPICIFILP